MDQQADSVASKKGASRHTSTQLSEMRLRGRFLFAVWGRIEESEVPAVVSTAVAAALPDDPLGFLARAAWVP